MILSHLKLRPAAIARALTCTLLCALAWAVACGPPARAAESKPEARISKAKILEYGVFSSTVTERQKVATVADGIRDAAKDFKLLRRGARVEAELGTGFGLRYVLGGAPRGATVLVDVVVRHPEMVNPDTQLPMTHSTAQYERTIGAVEHTVWSFDTPAGLVPGEYVIEILHQGRSLARQSFQVTVRK